MTRWLFAVILCSLVFGPVVFAQQASEEEASADFEKASQL